MKPKYYTFTCDNGDNIGTLKVTNDNTTLNRFKTMIAEHFDVSHVDTSTLNISSMLDTYYADKQIESVLQLDGEPYTVYCSLTWLY